MFCKKCGSWLPDDANFCTYCGIRVREEGDGLSKDDAVSDDVCPEEEAAPAPIAEETPVPVTEEPDGEPEEEEDIYDDLPLDFVLSARDDSERAETPVRERPWEKYFREDTAEDPVFTALESEEPVEETVEEPVEETVEDFADDLPLEPAENVSSFLREQIPDLPELVLEEEPETEPEDVPARVVHTASFVSADPEPDPKSRRRDRRKHAEGKHARRTDDPPLSVPAFIAALLISAIPVAGLIVMFVWSLGGTKNENRARFACALLILRVILLVLLIGVCVYFFLTAPEILQYIGDQIMSVFAF